MPPSLVFPQDRATAPIAYQGNYLSRLAKDATSTGFADSEEDFADDFIGQRIQPFRIEEEAKKLDGTNFIVASRFKPHAVRDGLLITGQQQYSGAAAARLIIDALGI